MLINSGHCVFAHVLFRLSSRYHLKDVIVGKIYFLLVRIKIKHMEVAIIKRETTGSGEPLKPVSLPWLLLLVVEISSVAPLTKLSSVNDRPADEPIG